MKDKSILVLFLLSMIILFASSKRESDVSFIQEEESVFSGINASIPEIKEEKSARFHYSFDIASDDSLMMSKATIKRNETLYSIFSKKRFSNREIYQITQRAKKEFNVKRLVPNTAYHWVSKAEQPNEVLYFIVEKNAREYVKVHLSDSIYAESGIRKSEFREETVSGIIESSLYNSLKSQNADPSLAFLMADVFAWQIDFYRIFKGDSYQVILNREYIDGRPTGESTILAAKFVNKKEPFYAFRFEDNGRARYFDENENSLQKTFLKAPLKFSWISSKYTQNRFHPVLKTNKAHLGTDYAAPKGTPVHAVADGVIEKAGYNRFNGNYVKIRHNSIYETGYLHFSKIAAGLKPGMKVKQGQVIGFVGETGLAAGIHLCYRFWKNGVQVDPFKQENPSANPIEPEFRVEYLTQMNLAKIRLDSLDTNHAAKDLFVTR